MDQNFLKITYHLGAKKMNAYLKMPSPTYHVLKKEVEMCLFEERKQPRCEIRTYWIDEDQDEIEIVNQCDYEIFMAKRLERQHLQVAPLNAPNNEEKEEQVKSVEEETVTKETSSSNSNPTKIPPAAGSYDYAVHERVECDSCLMSPIIGFRYKCIQCPNYDLCQNCEAKHIHSEHMMVRMPTNNCPDVVEAYVTGRTSGSGRRHGKRSKTSCPFVKTGISVVIDDDNDANKAEGDNGEKSDSPGVKERHHGRKHHRRHHRHNFLSHLYEMMHDLAEGGGAAAAAHAMGETASATKTTTTTSSSSSSATGPETTTKTFTSTSSNGNPIPEDPIGAAAAAAAANFAAQHAHEAAVKASEMAAKIAHETALKAAQNIAGNMTAGVFQTSSPSTSSSTQNAAGANKDAAGKKTEDTSSPSDPDVQQSSTPVVNSPSLETFAQFLDPQYMKTGMQILNNFSDMFAKILDPMEVSETNENQLYPNLRKNSATTSNKSSAASNLNSLDSEKKTDNEKSVDKEQTKETEKQQDSDISSHVEIDDLGSDSENESVSESFIKLDAPTKESNVSSEASSKSTTPPKSLDKSEKVVDFAQLSADLKAHIAEETKNNTTAATTTATITSTTTTANEPVVTTTSTSSSSMTSNTSNTTNDAAPKKPEEKRAVPVFHADERINNSIHAMMSMGFSNEGAWLTQLLESVNGNIPEALDLMSVAQRDGGR